MSSFPTTPIPAEFHDHGGASEPQLKYIGGLLGERDVPASWVARYGELVAAGELTKAKASEMITALQGRPRSTPEQPETTTVPAGRYALTEEDGVTRFYRLDRPTEGRWAGYTFLKIQASDDLHPIKDRARKARVIAAIGEDPAAASRLYGAELGSCGVCGRTLTDETSRAYGIGPVCRENTGW